MKHLCYKTTSLKRPVPQSHLIRLPLPNVKGWCLEMVNGLPSEDVLGVGREVALLALTDGITDTPLTLDCIYLGSETADVVVLNKQ